MNEGRKEGRKEGDFLCVKLLVKFHREGRINSICSLLFFANVSLEPYL